MSELTRDDLLGGLGGRRASTLLFAVQRRTAYLSQEARHATAPAICDDLVALKQRAFLSALATGRHIEVTPTIQELERFAPRWSYLVPPDPDGRADLARRVAATSRFRARDVPRLRTALHLDDVLVDAALRRRHGVAVDDLFATELPLRERFRWWWSRVSGRLEDLPPSWSAFALTLTQTVGAGVLALPIALAGLGPLPGLVLLVVLGLVNVLTVAAVAETFARTASVRFGGAYFGRVVRQYLGPGASAAVTSTLGLLGVFVLLAYYLGLSGTLAEATGVHALVWACALFVVSIYLISRGRLDATIATSLLVGAVNILILVVLSALAFSRLDPDHLTHAAVPLVSGRPFEPGVVQLIFGVVLLAFFGHTSVGNCARVVLHRDPSGRSLIRGTVAAMTTAIVLYSLWVAAVGSAVAPERLASETGTAIVPLAESVGPIALGVGSVFVVLAMGMAAVQFSLGLHTQAMEIIGARGRATRHAGYLPIVAVFGVTLAALVSGEGSFAGPLGLIGTLTAPLLAGVFPMLLLLASRRRCDQVSEGGPRWMGHPTVVVLVYLLFLVAIVAHGVVWPSWWERTAAVVVAVVVLLLTWRIVRTGSLRSTATVELRRDRELGRFRLHLTGGGQPVDGVIEVVDQHGGGVQLPVPGGAELPIGAAAVRLDLDALGVPAVEVWLHEVDPSGATRPLELPVSVADRAAGGTAVTVTLANGRGDVPGDGTGRTLEIGLGPAAAPARPVP